MTRICFPYTSSAEQIYEAAANIEGHCTHPSLQECEEFLQLIEIGEAALPAAVSSANLRVHLFPFVKQLSSSVDIDRNAEVVALDYRNGQICLDQEVGPIGFTADRKLVFVDLRPEEKQHWFALDAAGWMRDDAAPGRFRLPRAKMKTARTEPDLTTSHPPMQQQEDQELDHDSEVELLLHFGALNSYMGSYLMRLNKQHLNEAMWDEALEDAKRATALGVDSDREYQLFFYLQHFVEDLGAECGRKLRPFEQDQLAAYMFRQRDRLKFESLDDFREAAREWCGTKSAMEEVGLEKAGYPNVGKIYKVMPSYDLPKWGDLVKRINESIRMGFRQDDAVVEASTELEMPERLDFLEWYNLHVSGQASRYGLNDAIKQRSREAGSHAEVRMEQYAEKNEELTKFADNQFYYLPRFRTESESPKPTSATTLHPTPQAVHSSEQSARDFESARTKLMSRIFAIDKLLEKYKRVLNSEQLDGIEDCLNDLKKKIRKLKLATTIQDALIKTAGQLQKFAFHDGAAELQAIAADADQLPPPPTQQGDGSSSIFTEEAKNEKLKVIVSRLYDISVVLKNREVIRAIAEIDILLDELRMASFFPEIQDAQAKLIDAFGYASNKVEDVLPKLRGGLVLQPADDTITPVDKSTDMVGQLRELSKELQGGQKKSVQPEEDDRLKQLSLQPRSR